MIHRGIRPALSLSLHPLKQADMLVGIPPFLWAPAYGGGCGIWIGRTGSLSHLAVVFRDTLRVGRRANLPDLRPHPQ